MTAGVIDGFETVHVERQQGSDILRIAAYIGVEGLTVEKTRQRIDRRELED